MSWNEKMAVGVRLLDTDHQKLVGLLNELYDAVMKGQGKETLGKVLDGLVDYTKIHFAHEEKFFAQTNYPAAAAHKKEHDALTRQVLEVQKKYQRGQTVALSLEVMNFLKNWLVNHIQASDQKYGPYLNSKGIH
ncbi:MAG TPA: bacteriohemerythrin [Verrucomicrobiae bacterium]|nr:bacteriohemerythrin [Verrucomicrobiae bacterium]